MTTQADITARLATLVEDSEIVEGERASAQPRVASGREDNWAAQNPWLCTGRGPTGRLRNFRAMNDGKLNAAYTACIREGNDPVAVAAIRAEMHSRGQSC